MWLPRATNVLEGEGQSCEPSAHPKTTNKKTEQFVPFSNPRDVSELSKENQGSIFFVERDDQNKCARAPPLEQTAQAGEREL